MGCHYCGTTEDTRPYGPGGSDVCHPCATATPERNEAARQVFLVQVDAAAAISPIVFLGDDGPEPYVPGAD